MREVLCGAQQCARSLARAIPFTDLYFIVTRQNQQAQCIVNGFFEIILSLSIIHVLVPPLTSVAKRDARGLKVVVPFGTK